MAETRREMLIYAQAGTVDAAFRAKAVFVGGATLPGASALVAATNASEMRMFNCIAAMNSCSKAGDQTELVKNVRGSNSIGNM